MPRRALLFLALAVLAVAGCAGDGETTTVTVTVTRPATPEPGRTGDLEPAIEFVNAAAPSAKGSWAQSPITTAGRFLTVVGSFARETTITTPTPEAGLRSIVVITQEGLLDDSVRAVRYQLRLRLAADETWRIESATRTFACHPGRGQQDFGTALCR